jgi:aryl-alcohol dehydrogenase-like predicted oxidoreductase
MSLSTVPFGTTGTNITRVGFGAWAIRGSGWAYGWGDQYDALRRTGAGHGEINP